MLCQTAAVVPGAFDCPLRVAPSSSSPQRARLCQPAALLVPAPLAGLKARFIECERDVHPFVGIDPNCDHLCLPPSTVSGLTGLSRVKDGPLSGFKPSGARRSGDKSHYKALRPEDGRVSPLRCADPQGIPGLGRSIQREDGVNSLR